MDFGVMFLLHKLALHSDTHFQLYDTYIHILFPTQLYKITRTTLCWDDGKATTANSRGAALKKKQTVNDGVAHSKNPRK